MNLSEINTIEKYLTFCYAQQCQMCIIREIRPSDCDCAPEYHERIVKSIIIHNRKKKLAKLLESEHV